jgi:hypothetical protein
LTPANYTNARDRYEGFALETGVARRGKLVGVSFEIFEKAFKFTLHRVHLFTHVEDDLDTGEIDPEIACQREDYFEAFEIGVFVKAGVADRPGWLE